MGKSKSMDKASVVRIQKATTKANGGVTPKGSFAARAQKAESKNNK